MSAFPLRRGEHLRRCRYPVFLYISRKVSCLRLRAAIPARHQAPYLYHATVRRVLPFSGSIPVQKPSLHISSPFRVRAAASSGHKKNDISSYRSYGSVQDASHEHRGR